MALSPNQLVNITHFCDIPFYRMEVELDEKDEMWTFLFASDWQERWGEIFSVFLKVSRHLKVFILL